MAFGEFHFNHMYDVRQVLFKLDDSGNGKLIEINQLGKANPGLVVSLSPSPPSLSPLPPSLTLSIYLSLLPLPLIHHTSTFLQGFTIDSFRHMCILSGCDYLASVPGIGLGKALKLMKRFNKDPYRVSHSTHTL